MIAPYIGFYLALPNVLILCQLLLSSTHSLARETAHLSPCTALGVFQPSLASEETPFHSQLTLGMDSISCYFRTALLEPLCSSTQPAGGMATPCILPLASVPFIKLTVVL